ncbi:hypothetical protein [Neopusillimonas maritima]|uniref:Uncharacterized protein n=1 Tax=Neopusillimonas maritima TaxID=2026239 RepID=A0ABX9MZN5_9BURK|nr:hypothetical protein [Neopusillimonas maritima]RII84369.1 hypothetical protein CJO09_03925 [Neopusillimonas maritima]
MASNNLTQDRSKQAGDVPAATPSYREFELDLIDRLFDAQALLKLVLASEEPELNNDLSRPVVMASQRIDSVIQLLDGSSSVYGRKNGTVSK